LSSPTPPRLRMMIKHKVPSKSQCAELNISY
jgi:hypothetical protein